MDYGSGAVFTFQRNTHENQGIQTAFPCTSLVIFEEKV